MGNYNILWLDDAIEQMGHYVEALRKSEYFARVDIASSCNKALALVKKTHYDLMLVDINMPHPNGIHFIWEVLKINKNPVIVALSSYLYRIKYQNQLKAIVHPVELMDKVIPSPVSEDFDLVFVNKLVSLIELDRRCLKSANEQIETAYSIEMDPFHVSLEDWINMSTFQREKLNKDAKKTVASLINKEFENGAIWVLFLGSKKSVAASAKTEIDIPSESDIMEQARNRNAVPFQFSAPIGVEDMWASCENGPQYNKGYPTVTIELSVGKNIQIHFDTGNPVTFLSLEYLLTSGIIDKVPYFYDSGDVNGCDCEFVRFEERVLLKSQPSGDTAKYITLIARAVKNWDEFVLARKCQWDCKHIFHDRRNGVCKFRQGLIGRNILHDNEITLILDGKNKTTRISG